MIYILPNAEEVIPKTFGSPNFLPPKARHVHDSHNPRTTPTFLLAKPLSQLLLIDVLCPLVRPARHHAQHILGHNLRDNPRRPGPRDRTQNEPPPGPHMRHALLEEPRGARHMLEDLEHADNIVPATPALGRAAQLLHRGAQVGEPAGPQQQRVVAGVAARDGQHVGVGVQRRHAGRAAQARRRLREDAAAAPHVQVVQRAARRLR